MSRTGLQAVIDAWSATNAGLAQAEIDERMLGYVAMLRAIFLRGAATSEELAAARPVAAAAACSAPAHRRSRT